MLIYHHRRFWCCRQRFVCLSLKLTRRFLSNCWREVTWRDPFIQGHIDSTKLNIIIIGCIGPESVSRMTHTSCCGEDLPAEDRWKGCQTTPQSESLFKTNPWTCEGRQSPSGLRSEAQPRIHSESGIIQHVRKQDGGGFKFHTVNPVLTRFILCIYQWCQTNSLITVIRLKYIIS